MRGDWIRGRRLCRVIGQIPPRQISFIISTLMNTLKCELEFDKRECEYETRDEGKRRGKKGNDSQ